MAKELERICEKLRIRDDEEEVNLLSGDADDVEDSLSELCILGKLFTRKQFNGEALMATMKKVWNPSKGLTHTSLGDNLFLFKFNDMLDKKKFSLVAHGVLMIIYWSSVII